jgi:DNA primase
VRPNPADRATEAEREALKLALQHPDLVAGEYERVEGSAFTDASYARLHAGVVAAGSLVTASAGAAWIGQVREQLPPDLYSLVSELAVEPFRNRAEVNALYAGQILAGLLLRSAEARVRELFAELRRAQAEGDIELQAKVGESLAQWDRYRRQLHERANSSS